jgi:hypothetical protein
VRLPIRSQEGNGDNWMAVVADVDASASIDAVSARAL